MNWNSKKLIPALIKTQILIRKVKFKYRLVWSKFQKSLMFKDL